MSKAALTSSSASNEMCPSPTEESRSDSTRSRNVVEWCFRKPDWSFGSNPCSAIEFRELPHDDSFNDLGHEGKVRNWPVIFHVRWIQSVLLEGRRNDGSCLGRR